MDQAVGVLEDALLEATDNLVEGGFVTRPEEAEELCLGLPGEKWLCANGDVSTPAESGSGPVLADPDPGVPDRYNNWTPWRSGVFSPRDG